MPFELPNIKPCEKCGGPHATEDHELFGDTTEKAMDVDITREKAERVSAEAGIDKVRIIKEMRVLIDDLNKNLAAYLEREAKSSESMETFVSNTPAELSHIKKVADMLEQRLEVLEK